LPLATEKSALPAIIVTPSSPTHETDFSIAFLAPPEKPTLLSRVRDALPSTSTIHLKARTTIILLLLFFIMACHLLTHRLSVNRPHIDFAATDDASSVSDAASSAATVSPHDKLWLGLEWLIHFAGPVEGDQKRDFVIRGGTL
jgi:hypothetical protein